MKRLALLLFFFPVLASAAQFARPDGASSVGDSCDSGSSGTYADIDEVVPSNSDYASCSGAIIDNYAYAMRQFTTSNVTDPVSSTGHVLRFRIGSCAGETNAYLMQGISTTIAVVASSCPGTTESYTLSAAEANAITDYSTLEIRFEAVCDTLGTCGDSSAGFTAYWAELEVPDAGGGGGATRRVMVVP